MTRSDPLRRPIHPSYLIWFAGFAVWWIGSEILRGEIPEAWWWWWPSGFVYLLTVEIAGARRTDANETDTWSELHWLAGAGLAARDALLRGSGAALAWRMATLPHYASDAVTFDGWFLATPWWLLCAGVGLWLWRHLPDLGEQG